MPSQWHEALVLLFRNRPSLAVDLIRDALRVELPAHAEARIDSAELADVQTAEYRADVVVRLLGDETVGAVVVEIQLSIDGDKRFSWPRYVTVLRSRLKREVSLLVVAPDEAVARWAAEPIALGGGNWFTPLVLGPAAIPEVTDEAAARTAPELAVLSAMAHGRDANVAKAARIGAAAQNASADLDEDRSRLYLDLVWASLSEAARKELQAMDPAKYEYQSEFARRWIALGREEGKAEGKAEGQSQGRADLLLRQLTLRYGELGDEVRARISTASIAELDAIGERLLTAKSLKDALGSR